MKERNPPTPSSHYADWEKYFAYVFKKYGVTQARWMNKWRQQGGKCAICLRATKITVDHSHRTGKFRGLLCAHCNGLLGLVEKFPWAMKNMKAYLA